MHTELPPVKLTQYSHGAGCGCKISPKILDEILQSVGKQAIFPNLLVGNETKDDAAVYDLGNGTGLVSTTDFFMPIVDDPVKFGKIASVNAISPHLFQRIDQVMVKFGKNLSGSNRVLNRSGMNHHFQQVVNIGCKRGLSAF